MSDEPKGYEQALGAVPWTPDTEPSEVVIRRMRDGVEVGERFETRQRGDTYRRRALCLLKIAQIRQRPNRNSAYDLKNRLELCKWDLVAARDHAAISLARAASDGLMREAAESQAAGLAGLLDEARMWLGSSEMPPYTELRKVMQKIDAALAERAAVAGETGER